MGNALDDVIEVLISGVGDAGVQAIAMLEDIVTDIDSADQFIVTIAAAVVLALFICSIVFWGTLDRRR